MVNHKTEQTKATPKEDEIALIKSRYKLPEDRVARKENPADGYALGIHFSLSAILPAVFGMWLDDVFETGPWLFLLMLGLGFASGFWHIWKKSNEK